LDYRRVKINYFFDLYAAGFLNVTPEIRDNSLKIRAFRPLLGLKRGPGIFNPHFACMKIHYLLKYLYFL